MQEITMYHYLFLGLLLFLIGLFGSITSKHIIKVLICIEFILTGVNINFVTFATFCDNVQLDGFIMALFYVAIGAVELAVALYIFYLMYIQKESENIDKYGDL
ncbi:MAG: NADH-quinone oxidoreductase subunit NuoK [Cyanobacteria bacterium SIG31]|nr:NADH-quinone oxidoreductase subunit NuoK [Cyanobacteria bacterium SIG31]